MLMRAKKNFKWSFNGHIKEYVTGETFEITEKTGNEMLANNYAIRHEEKMSKAKPENKQYKPQEENKSQYEQPKKSRSKKKKIENVEETETQNEEVDNE